MSNILCQKLLNIAYLFNGCVMVEDHKKVVHKAFEGKVIEANELILDAEELENSGKYVSSIAREIFKSTELEDVSVLCHVQRN